MPTYMKYVSFANTKRAYDKTPISEGGGWSTSLMGLKSHHQGLLWRDLKQKYDALLHCKAVDHLTVFEEHLLTSLKLDLLENLKFADDAGFDGIEGRDDKEFIEP